jgi:hypothetical protein
MRAQQAPTVIDVLIALHRLHLSRSVIGKLTGFSGTYVGMLRRKARRFLSPTALPSHYSTLPYRRAS